MQKAGSDFNLKAYLTQNQKQIDSALEAILPPEKGVFKTIHAALRYSIFAGGKRLRPICCIAAYQIFKPHSEDLSRVLPAACSLEMIHTYSLIHDDLPCMDNDDFRRGKPTNHKVFGEAMAVLAGDSLLTLAFETLSNSPNVKPEILLRAVQKLSHISGTFGLIGGQVEDLEAEGKQLKGPELESIHQHKTAALIQTSIWLGGLIGEADEKDLEKLALFGEKVGLAFQIVDDILDIQSSTETLGKTAGKDADQNKSTYPSVYGLAESKKMASRLKDEAICCLESFGESAEPLKSIALYVIERNN